MIHVEKVREIREMGEIINLIQNFKVPTSIDEAWILLNSFSFRLSAVMIGVLVLLAIRGYKIFKSLIYIGASLGLAYIGKSVFATLIPDSVKALVPAELGIDFGVMIALVFAICGILLTRLAYRFTLFGLGGAVGFILGTKILSKVVVSTFTYLTFLNTPLATNIIGVLSALFCAVVFVLLFKYLYIIGTSIGCTILASLLLAIHLLPGGNDAVANFMFMVIGAIGGIIMMIHQFREEQKSYEIKF